MPRLKHTFIAIVVISGCSLFKAHPGFGPDDDTGGDAFVDGSVDQSFDSTSDGSNDAPSDDGPDMVIDRCGNNAVDDGELCDLDTLGDNTCVSAGFGGGTLSCDSNCQLDTSACFGCNYFIANTGDDLNPGDEDNPWATFDNLSTLDQNTSQTVCLQRGDTFLPNGEIPIAWSGNPVSWLSIRAYGTGALPVVSGLTTLDTPTQVDPVTNVWQAQPIEPVSTLTVDGIAMTRTSILNNDNTFKTTMQGTIEFRLPVGVVPTVVEGGLTHGFTISSETGSVRFVEFAEIALRDYARPFSVVSFGNDVTNLRFRDLEVTATETGLSFLTAGIGNVAKVEIRDSLFNGRNGSGISYTANPGPNREITIQRNRFAVFADLGRWVYGINLGHGSGFEVLDNVFLEEPGSEGSAIGFYVNPFGSHTDILLERNFFYGLSTGAQAHALGNPANFVYANNVFVNNDTAMSAGMGGGGYLGVIHNTIVGERGLTVYGRIAELYNNVFDTTAITIFQSGGNNRVVESNYNLFVTPEFMVEGVSTTFSEWRALGYDGLSIDANGVGYASDGTPDEPEYYRLLASSLANDAGVATQVISDFVGTPRNDPPEVGAFETVE